MKRIAVGWVGMCVALAASGAAPADEPFLKTLWHGLAVQTARRFDSVYDRIDWAALSQEAAKAADAEERQHRQDLVALWQVLARLHDFGTMCARASVFEWKARLLLKGDEESLRSVREVLGRCKAPKDVTFDPAPFRRYLATEPLPPWALSLRFVAAGVLAGEGDREGMRVLVQASRPSPAAGAKRPGFGAWALREALPGAHTEAALPLWAEVLKDEQEAVRRWAAQNVASVQSERAEPLLVGCLSDTAYAVRREAALELMGRGRQEAIPVLQEILRRDFDGGLDVALKLAPICCALEAWGVPDVPWAKLEGLLTDRATRGDTAHWRAITLAGHCLSAGRTKVAVPFLQRALDHTHEGIALHAAHTLLKNGSGLGIERVARHIATASKQWSDAYNDLVALAEFLALGPATTEEQAAAVAVARRAWERREALFRGYAFRLVEALGQMGMLLRVAKAEDGLKLTTVIDIPYQAAGRRKRIPLVWLAKARLASIAASAKQEGIALPEEFLAKVRAAELDALAALCRAPDPPMAREIAEAEKALKGAPED